MPHLTRSLCGLAFAGLTLTASPVRADDVLPLGDTVLQPLGRDVLAATSASLQPTVRHAGQTVRIRILAADASTATAPSLALSTDVTVGGTAGTFRLVFNGQTTSASHFDGRFLAGRDLTREQGYRMEADATFGLAYSYDLYRGGLRVAAADVADGVAPFVLEGVDRTEGVYSVGTAALPDGGEELEVHSWSLGTWTATFDDGPAFTVDHVVVRAHELGHVIGIRSIGDTTVGAAGVRELRVGAEDVIAPDGAPLSAAVNADGTVDVWSSSVGGADVHSVLVPSGSTTVDKREIPFTPPAGHRIRLRSRRDGAAFGPWSTWAATAKLSVPAPIADEALDDFEVEIYKPGSPTIASSGYIRVKKLNTGG